MHKDYYIEKNSRNTTCLSFLRIDREHDIPTTQANENVDINKDEDEDEDEIFTTQNTSEFVELLKIQAANINLLSIRITFFVTMAVILIIIIGLKFVF